MFKNYWKIALRQLGKQKLYSAVKIGGFALGIAACMLIALYIHTQLSYDKNFPDWGRVYRLTGQLEENGYLRKGTGWQAPFAQAIKTEFPEVEETGRLMKSTLFIGAGSNQMRPVESTRDTYEEGFAYVDSSMLDLFQLKMIYGDRQSALREPHTMVLARSVAEKYYPGVDPVGRLVVLNDDRDHPWKIGGVMQDPPENTHLQFPVLLSLSGHELWPGEQTTWLASNYDVYIRLRKDADPKRIADQISVVITRKYWLPVLKQAGVAASDLDMLVNKFKFNLQPLPEVHLTTDVEDGLPHVDGKYIWLFGAVAVFILLLASINFVNLSTARSANRAREVGVRKVVGSSKNGLVRQFLLESVVTTFFALLVAVALAWLLLPLFNRIAGTSMHFPWTAWWLAPGLLLISLFIGLMAGLYPSFYLSAFRPVLVLKGNVSRGSGHSGLRKGLVVFQFTTSVVLIVATMVVYGQMRFILDSKMGFNKDQVLLIQGTGTLDRQLPAFKESLKKLSGVQDVTVSDFLPISGGKRNGNTFYREGRSHIDPGAGAQVWTVDVDYLKVMGMKLAEGRNFSPVIPSDSQALIINRAMAVKMGLQHPLGQRLVNGDGPGRPIIGVVEDFNFESVRMPVGPLCMVLDKWASIVAVRIRTTDMKGLLAGVDGVWKSYSPQQTLRYTFLDESFAHTYADVQQTGNIFSALSVLAMSIACLGLFALSAFMAGQRRKEMGIRKVLGATIWQVTGLLSRDFLRLVALAIVIGTPLAGWMMHVWLQDFVYRISLGWEVFAGAAVLVLLVALATVSVQAVRAGTENPATALRSE